MKSTDTHTDGWTYLGYNNIDIIIFLHKIHSSVLMYTFEH